MEIEYRGWSIIEVESDAECMGVPMGRVFQVADEFGERLPLTQNNFWTPQEAAAAIDFVLARGGKWKPAYNHEFNMAVAYRRNAIDVYISIQAIRSAVIEAKDLDDNPGPEVEAILYKLHRRSVG